MALPALLGAGARAVGGSMVKAGGRAVASKVLGRKRGTQPGRIIPGGGEQGGGGRGGAIVPRTKMVSPKEMKSLKAGDPVSPGKDPLKSIYSNVILIEKILKGTYASERDQLRKQRQDDKKSDKAAQEKKLETKSPKIDRKKGLIKKVPGTGIFGMIKNFIGSILLGYFAVRLVKYLPQLMGLLKGLAKVVEFVTDVGIFLVDGLASFINFAYNVYDGTRNIAKKLGGDALLGAFDGLMKAVEIAITVLTFALGAKSLEGFDRGRGRGRGRGGGRTGISGRGAGRTRTTSPQAARRYAQRFGRDAATKRFGEQGVKSLGGKYARSGATNLARKATVGVLGKGGTKAALKIVKPLVKRVPIIGGVLEFALSLLAGEPVGKAAFRAVGSGLGTWIGGALGSLIPVPFVGTAIGAFIGGAGGSELAGAMYDAFFGGKEKQPEPEEPEAKQSGGSVGRGFQQSTLKQQKKGIRKKPSFTKLKAPADGKIETGEKTDKAWWDFLGWAGTGGQAEMMNLGPGGQLLANKVVNLGNEFGEHPFFGPILSLAAKIILGNKPNQQDYKNVGYGLNMLVGEGIEKGKIGEGIKGYADGGMVRTMGGVNIGRWATDAFKKELSNTLYKNFDNKNMTGQGGDSNNLTSNSPTGGTGLTASQISGAALNMTQKQAFATVYELAKKHKAKFPEIVAAQAMHETGYMNPNLRSVFNSTGRTNAFGQTGDRGYGVLPRAGDSSGWTKYPTLEKAVEDNIKLWHRVDNHPGNYEAFDTPIKGILSVVGAYSPNTDPANVAKGYTETSYVGAMQKIMKSMGFDPYKANELTDLSSDAQLQAVSPLGASPGGSTPEGTVRQMEAQKNAGMSVGNGNRMYLHWSAGGYNSIVGPYHTVFTGDGTMHRRYDYNKVTGHTESRNSGSISLSVMAMAGAPGSYQWPTQEQIEGLVNEAARIGKEWGWSPSDVSIPNVMTHGEAGSNVDGASPHTNYGPYGRGANAVSSIDSMASGRIDDFERWDLDMLSPSDQYGEGGNKIRSMIAKRLGEMSNGGDDAKRSHAGTKLSNREQMLKILPGQSLLDENTSKALGATNLARFNAASTPEEMKKIAGQIAGVSDYAPYEQGAEQTVVVVDPPQQQEDYSNSSGSGGGMIPIGGSSHDPFEFLDYQG
jgi:hypothetical protein